MRTHKVVNRETNEILYEGTLSECQAFLKGMYVVDSSNESLWFDSFIEDK